MKIIGKMYNNLITFFFGIQFSMQRFQTLSIVLRCALCPGVEDSHRVNSFIQHPVPKLFLAFPFTYIAINTIIIDILSQQAKKCLKSIFEDIFLRESVAYPVLISAKTPTTRNSAGGQVAKAFAAGVFFWRDIFQLLSLSKSSAKRRRPQIVVIIEIYFEWYDI